MSLWPYQSANSGPVCVSLFRSVPDAPFDNNNVTISSRPYSAATMMGLYPVDCKHNEGNNTNPRQKPVAKWRSERGVPSKRTPTSCTSTKASPDAANTARTASVEPPWTAHVNAVRPKLCSQKAWGRRGGGRQA